MGVDHCQKGREADERDRENHILDVGVLALDANCSSSRKLFLFCGEPSDVLYTLREDTGSDLEPISKSDFRMSETCA